MDEADNPYRTPAVQDGPVAPVVPAGPAAVERRAHLPAERKLRIAAVYFMVTGALLAPFFVVDCMRVGGPSPIPALGASLATGLGITMLIVGIGLWRRRESDRRAGVVLAGVICLILPVGTFLGLVWLRDLRQPGVRRICQPDYAEILADTRGIKSRRGWERATLFLVIAIIASLVEAVWLAVSFF